MTLSPKSYLHTFLLGLDRFGAALFFNQPDMTISSLAWVVRTFRNANANNLEHDVAARAINIVKPGSFQYAALVEIGDFLEHFWPGHCEGARQGDVDTAARTIVLLTTAPRG